MINIVLFQPEIPFNTAAIIRTCVGAEANLHIIKPTGFDLDKDHHDLKRGSTNYINELELKTYENFEEFEEFIGDNKLYLLSRYGKKVYTEIPFNDNNEEIFIMFGKESSGIDQYIVDKYEENTFRVPMSKKMRSLNLSNIATLITFDLLRKVDFNDLEKLEIHKPQ